MTGSGCTARPVMEQMHNQRGRRAASRTSTSNLRPAASRFLGPLRIRPRSRARRWRLATVRGVRRSSTCAGDLSRRIADGPQALGLQLLGDGGPTPRSWITASTGPEELSERRLRGPWPQLARTPDTDRAKGRDLQRDRQKRAQLPHQREAMALLPVRCSTRRIRARSGQPPLNCSERRWRKSSGLPRAFATRRPPSR